MAVHALDHDALDRLRQTHPAWRLLAADHAPLLPGFFESAFIRPNRRAIPAPELIAHLDAHLSQLAETHAAERYHKAARQYLDDWAAPERGFLRKYYPKTGDDAEFDLTPSAEKALEWIQSLLPVNPVTIQSDETRRRSHALNQRSTSSLEGSATNSGTAALVSR